MTKFLCDPAAFDLVVDYATRRRVGVQTWNGTPAQAEAEARFGMSYLHIGPRPAEIAAVLYEANVRSLEALESARTAFDRRRGEGFGPVTFPYTFRPVAIEIDPRLVLTQIRCIREQSWHLPGWETSLANVILQAITEQAILDLSIAPYRLRERDVRPVEA